MAGEADRATVRQRVIYSGRVQGVCFRAISQEISGQFAVVGYVRNRPDGTVELEAEGAAGEVEAFLGAVARQFSQNIRRAERTAMPLRGDETGFEVRY